MHTCFSALSTRGVQKCCWSEYVLYRRQRPDFFSNLLHIKDKARDTHCFVFKNIAQLVKCVILTRLGSIRSSARHVTLHLYGPTATVQQASIRHLEAPAFLQVVDLRPEVCMYIGNEKENIHVISRIFRVSNRDVCDGWVLHWTFISKPNRSRRSDSIFPR